MSERTEPDALLSTREVAEILRVTDRSVLRYIADGHLPAVRVAGQRLWRIRRADVEALLTSEASA
ncbi:helix-turn-helix domain-containing protein [Mycobacterium avium]